MPPLVATHCSLWFDGAHDRAFNMAADTVLLDLASTTGQAFLRFYGWTEKAVSIGYFQPTAQVVPAGYAFVRRPTGGGVVYHDIDLTFSLAVPKAHHLVQVDRFTSYRLINDAVRAAAEELGYTAWLTDTGAEVEDRAQLICFQSPARFDVMVRDGKLCGGAQRRTAHGMLMQSSLDLRPLHRHDRNQVTRGLANHLLPLLGQEKIDFQPDATFLNAANALATSRYADYTWNHKR